ncbi:TatD family hydrolase [bacterium]|nr:TatD family hydrolase [bacterium]
MLIDTHAHLYFDWFDQDRDEVIARAQTADVKKIINIAIDLKSSRKCIELTEEYDGLFATVGIHPNDSTQLSDKALEELAELCRHPKVVAIGEIGLDLYRERSPREIQFEAFRQQIRLAKKCGLPIVIHNREAGQSILEILQSEGSNGLTGVFHCFSEDKAIAQQVIEMGYYISFTGNLTFKKSKLPEIARNVPLQRILLETDSPFLSPEPKRGRRNEPVHVCHIAEKLAEIHGTSLEEIGEITSRTAIRLFGLGDGDME